MSESVVHTISIDQPIESVWKNLTDSGSMCKWMLFKSNDFQPEVGHGFKLADAEGFEGEIDCSVIQMSSPNLISYTWSTVGQDGMAHSTVVTFTLHENADGGTEVTVDQSGFRAQATEEIEGAKQGWSSMLEALSRSFQ